MDCDVAVISRTPENPPRYMCRRFEQNVRTQKNFASRECPDREGTLTHTFQKMPKNLKIFYRVAYMSKQLQNFKYGRIMVLSPPRGLRLSSIPFSFAVNVFECQNNGLGFVR
jgi:hypothetical protein